MSRRYGRFVDMRIIQRRMDEKDLRRQRELRRRSVSASSLLAPEVWPYASVEIVPATEAIAPTAPPSTPARSVVEAEISPANPDDRWPVVDVTLTPKTNGGDR